jgi:hypothetical protein
MIAALRGPWAHFESITVGALSVLFMFGWLIFPLPRPEKLTEIVGTLTSYSVEADQSWLARFGRPRTEYVLFSLADHAGRFWSESLTPTNVTEVVPRSGLRVHFYTDPASRNRLVNGDGTKAYGLSIEGNAPQSAEEALSQDRFRLYYELPALGVLGWLLAVFRWRQKARRVAQAGD